MKLTKAEIKEIVRENLGGYFGGVRPTNPPEEPFSPAGKVTNFRNPELEERMAEVVEAVGEEEFMKELIQTISDEELNALIKKIAKEKQLTLGGVKYLQ